MKSDKCKLFCNNIGKERMASNFIPLPNDAATFISQFKGS